jgi:hypothetical protein
MIECDERLLIKITEPKRFNWNHHSNRTVTVKKVTEMTVDD